MADNAYLGFWDTERSLFGVVHVSTSPNPPASRARLSLVVGGRAFEIVEELPSGSFSSPSIEFDVASLHRRRSVTARLGRMADWGAAYADPLHTVEASNGPDRRSGRHRWSPGAARV